MNIVIRPGTIEDILEFYDETLPFTVRCWVAEADGKPGCIAGVYRSGNSAVAFSTIHRDFLKEEAVQAPKLLIWRTAKKLFEEIKSLNIPLVALVDENIGTPKFLKSLGFIQANKEGTLFKWQTQ